MRLNKASDALEITTQSKSQQCKSQAQAICLTKYSHHQELLIRTRQKMPKDYEKQAAQLQNSNK